MHPNPARLGATRARESAWAGLLRIPVLFIDFHSSASHRLLGSYVSPSPSHVRFHCDPDSPRNTPEPPWNTSRTFSRGWLGLGFTLTEVYDYPSEVPRGDTQEGVYPGRYPAGYPGEYPGGYRGRDHGRYTWVYPGRSPGGLWGGPWGGPQGDHQGDPRGIFLPSPAD